MALSALTNGSDVTARVVLVLTPFEADALDAALSYIEADALNVRQVTSVTSVRESLARLRNPATHQIHNRKPKERPSYGDEENDTD